MDGKRKRYNDFSKYKKHKAAGAGAGRPAAGDAPQAPQHKGGQAARGGGASSAPASKQGGNRQHGSEPRSAAVSQQPQQQAGKQQQQQQGKAGLRLEDVLYFGGAKARLLQAHNIYYSHRISPDPGLLLTTHTGGPGAGSRCR